MGSAGLEGSEDSEVLEGSEESEGSEDWDRVLWELLGPVLVEGLAVGYWQEFLGPGSVGGADLVAENAHA